MDSGRVALDAGGQVLEVAVVPVLVSHLVVEEVHVRRASLLLDQLGDLRVIPGDEKSFKNIKSLCCSSYSYFSLMIFPSP